MGYEPTVHCRHCGDPLDVYESPKRRFCSEDCAAAYEENNGNLVFRDKNGKPVAVLDVTRILR